ncbi:hypothetical protein GW575_00365 [Campylobacter sp. MIT 19-121]|uniref:uracil-DNA glycosylase family protein n=1 Tax=Campylobacter sp. MIT 19-121 TaxID=2703906 RepID=UPI001389BB66|nr:uracil-DNA glycosylase family protein [Campylobacter sp. MIT 19-121]NDJ26411.1 hypothetical protein [Campylobacter sp. MIT 19-121]
MKNLRSLHYLKAFGYEFIDKELDFMPQSKDYEELRLKVQNCQLCPLSKRRRFCIMQNTFKHYGLMVVGDFLSTSENDSKTLLNSAEGIKLKLLLKENLGLEREDFYMSYIYKCYSQNKDDDFALKQCLPYLFDELFFINPKIILCLGKQSFYHLGFEDFTRLRGEILHFKQSLIMPSFDIKFILKNPSFEQEFIKDLTKLKAFL